MPLVADFRRRLLPQALVLVGAALFGAILGADPKIGVALFGATAICALAFLAPVTHLTMFLVLTIVVPYSYQNSVTGPGGLLPSDLFLLTGLVRAAVVLVETPLDRRRGLAILACLVFLAGALLQFVHGLRAEGSLSDAGAEFRQLLSYGVLLVALPIVMEPLGRSRVLKGLLIVGLLLGLWGIAQWALSLSFGEAGDVGVRSGVRLTTAGVGQVQGGLFGFPVAVAVAYALLISGEIRTLRARALVTTILVLNVTALLLTFERTFWVAAVAAIGFVTLRMGAGPRARALIVAPVAVVLGLLGLSLVAPAELATARERLLSINQYGNDNSVRYRVIESEHVLAKIVAQPIVGSGLGDTIWWGRPYAGVPPTSHKFSHNGYLWLAWKIGIPLTLLLTLLLAAAIMWRRGPPSAEGVYSAARIGAQASLFALVIINITWPSFRTPSITPLMGLFIAIAATPPVALAGGGRGQPLSERNTPT